MVAKNKKPRLNARDKRFVDEYIIDLDPQRAAVAAGYSATVARTKAYLWVSNSKTKPLVYEAVQKAMEKRSERTKITADMVLQRYWAIATADANEIMQVRRLCCRHCYGKDHLYQWIDEAEYERVCREVEEDAGDKEPQYPSDDGGYDFNPTLSPHAKCPKCFGEGRVDAFFQDTRNLSPAAKMLYAGVKLTQNGMEVKTHDQQAALNQIARHLGMFNDKIMLQGDKENPLQMLLQQLPGALIKPVGDD